MAVAGVGRGPRRVVVVVVLAMVAGLLAACEESPPMIQGQVTHTENGSHPAGVEVRAYSASSEELVAETVTDSEGRYVLRESDLAEGNYRLRFSDNFWWENAASWADATDVAVVHGAEATVIDVSLVPTVGSLTGTVTDGSGPVAAATVEAISPITNTVVASTTTDSSGGFNFTSLPTGAYRVRVSDAPGLAATYHPAAPTASGARSVTVVADQSTGGADVVLPAAATLTGTVMSDGAPLAGIAVVAITPTPSESHATAITGPDGRFTLTGLSPIGYLLTLADPDSSVVVGAEPDDPDSGIVYPLAAGDTLEVGQIDFGAGGTTAPTITTTALPPSYVGMPVLVTLDAVGGAGGDTWSVTGLPPDLSLDTATGVISGTPTETGTFSVELVVADARGQATTATLPLEVLAGMPEGCVVDDCALVDVAVGTVELTADAVVGATRHPDGTLAGLTLGPAAPPINVGQVIVAPQGGHTPEGVIVEATGVQDLGGGNQEVAVVRANLTDAYESALIKSSDAEATVTGPLVEATESGDRTAAAAAAVSCDGAPQIQVSPNIDLDVDPNVSMLFGRNLFGWGNIFVGTGGLKVFQVDLDTTLTVGLSGRIGGRVHCDVSVPAAFAAVPVGPGAATFRLQPSLSLNASAAVTLDTSVTLRCSMTYRWADGQESRTQWCRPTATSPNAGGTGADVTVGGGIGVAVTYNELVGVVGNIEAKIHAGYHPWERPRGQIDGGVTASIGGCLGCLFGWNLGTVTLWDGELYKNRVFYTWGYDPLPTCGSLANTHWEGTWWFDETSSGTWHAEFAPDGSLHGFEINLFPHERAVSDVHLDCQSISFVGTMGLATWSATFDPSRTHLEGTAQVFNGNIIHWTGDRL